ncbi:GSCFA domain-containing protein [Paracoccus sp. SM22M-07]|uniref:GSCFA domain-containing protein n=1 Tax=Paracoccus sp. SM22M-07 TaxID=1520813 RepID=UPI000930500C|nr:GSCFA domain-containing protein [Paracoccus sp. SM22M-07]
MKATNPYRKLPRRAFWSTSVAKSAKMKGMVDDLWQPSFQLTKDHPVATVGSCFAQHISSALVQAGFKWVQAERPTFGLSEQAARDFGYSIFSVRTGNIYTTKMLRQWLSWVRDPETQDTEFWESQDAVFDPVRPQIEPGGFEDAEDMAAARKSTIAAFHRAIEEASVFIFTLGLTEYWENIETGLVYASCPGTVAGEFDPALHRFRNSKYPEVLEDLEEIRKSLRAINPEIKLLLTVSPVPLVATAEEGKHVLTATTHSKSTLRSAAGDFSSNYQDVDYFPSFEIVTHPGLDRQMFEDDRRSVRPDGVDFVMEHFLAGLGLVHRSPTSRGSDGVDAIATSVEETQKADEIVCEEIELERFNDNRD